MIDNMVFTAIFLSVSLGITMTARATGYYDGYPQQYYGQYGEQQYPYQPSYPEYGVQEQYQQQYQDGYYQNPYNEGNYEQYPAYQNGYYSDEQQLLQQESTISENPSGTDAEVEVRDREKELNAAKKQKKILDVLFSPLIMGGVAGLTTAVIVNGNKNQPSATPTDQSFPAPCVQAVCYIVNPLKQTATLAPSSPKRRYTYINGIDDMVTEELPTAFFASKDYEGLVNQGNISGLACAPNCSERVHLVGLGGVHASALINDTSASIAGDKIIGLYGIETHLYNFGNIGLQTESIGMKVVGKNVVQEYRALNVGIISSNSPTNTRGMQGINGVTLINTGSITMTNPQTGTWNYGMELQGSYGYAYNYNTIRADVGMVVTGDPNNTKGGYIFNYGTLTTYRGGMVAYNHSVAINGAALYLYSNGNNAQHYYAMQGRNNSVLFNDKTGYIEVATLSTNYAFDIDSTSTIYNAGEVNCSNGALCVFSPDTDRNNAHSERCPVTICPPRPPPPANTVSSGDEITNLPMPEEENVRGLWGYIAVSHSDGGVGRVVMQGVSDVDVSGLRVTADFSRGIDEKNHTLYSVLVADNFINTDAVYSDTIVWKANAMDDGNGNLNVHMEKVDYTTLATKKTMTIATNLENNYHGSNLYNSLNVQDEKTFNTALWQVSGNDYYRGKTPITTALLPMARASVQTPTIINNNVNLSLTMDETVMQWHSTWAMPTHNNHRAVLKTIGLWDTQKLSAADNPAQDTLGAMIAIGIHSEKAWMSWLGLESTAAAVYTKSDAIRHLDYGDTKETLTHNAQNSSAFAQSGVYVKAPTRWADMRLQAGIGAFGNQYGTVVEKGNQDFALSINKSNENALYAHYGFTMHIPFNNTDETFMPGNLPQHGNAGMLEASMHMITPLWMQQTERIATTTDGDVFHIHQYDKTRMQAAIGYNMAWQNGISTSFKALYIYNTNHNAAINASLNWAF